MYQNLAGVKPGDELLKIDNSVQRKRSSREPRVVRVHKVGRTLIHVLQDENRPDGRTDTYRIDGGVINDGYGHTRLVTRDFWETEQRRDAVKEALRSHGVEVRPSIPVPVLERMLAILEEAGD